MHELRSWTWEEFRALPSEEVTVDIHCVTQWSKLDTVWQGVSVDTLLDGVETAAEHVVQVCDGGYTTNLPLEDVTGGKAWVAFAYDDKPLDPEHGGPARMLVPHLHFWKSAEWVRGLHLEAVDELGFWEVNGYHNYGDPGESSGTGETDLAGRGGRRRRFRDGSCRDDRLRRARLASASGRPARRRPAHRRRRLPGAAQLLDRICADASRIDLTVERVDDGEVSPYLTEELREGDQIDLRGPVGGYFVWEPAKGGLLLLVAGGSGVVPLMAMLRARETAGSDAETRLLLSSRGWDDVIYRDELERLEGDGLTVVHTLTRSQPPSWTGHARRVDAEMLAEALVQLGHEPHDVKTERFGPTGG